MLEALSLSCQDLYVEDQGKLEKAKAWGLGFAGFGDGFDFRMLWIFLTF